MGGRQPWVNERKRGSFHAFQRQLEIAGSLGSGKNGIVLLAKHKIKPAGVAIRVLRFEESTSAKSRCTSGSKNWS